MQPKISVVIPVFNAEKYIDRCIQSILRQSMSNIEIICVDDGSDDASLDLLRWYESNNSNIIVISQKNLHAGVARNTGLKAARGEYVHFLDIDDYICFNPDIYNCIYEEAKKLDLDVLRFLATGFSSLAAVSGFAPGIFIDVISTFVYGCLCPCFFLSFFLGFILKTIIFLPFP